MSHDGMLFVQHGTEHGRMHALREATAPPVTIGTRQPGAATSRGRTGPGADAMSSLATGLCFDTAADLGRYDLTCPLREGHQSQSRIGLVPSFVFQKHCCNLGNG